MRRSALLVMLLLVASMAGCVGTDGAECPEPLSPIDTVQDYRPTFVWDGDGSWESYNIVVRSSTGIVIDDEVGSESLRPEEGLPNGGYEWAVRAWDGQTWTPFSRTAVMVINSPVVSRTIEWDFMDEPMSVTVDVPLQAVQEHSVDDHSQGITERVDPDDPCVTVLASGLEAIADSLGLDVAGRVNLTLAMVQEGIDYRFDIASTGEAEYFRHPVETIADGVGDCEDKSFLFLSLMASPWLDLDGVALLLPEGSPTHMAAAVSMDADWCEPFAVVNDGALLFCETVHLGMGLGEVPVEWRGATAEIVPV